MEPILKKIAILAADGFEDAELLYPYYRLKEAGYEVKVITTEKKNLYGEYGYPMTCDLVIEELDEEIIDTFNGVIIPGGIKSSDILRRSKKILDFVKVMNEKGKLVAAISYAGWILISANLIDGRKVTSYYSIRHDMKRSGVKYENSSVVIDGNLITSRMSEDLPNFLKAILNFLK